MVNWPGIIKHSGDDELIYIRDQAEWDGDVDLHACPYDVADYLVDSSGNIFTLNKREGHDVTPDATGNSFTLHEILGLIKAHAGQQGSCCVAKLYAPTIVDAFKIVASLDDAISAHK